MAGWLGLSLSCPNLCSPGIPGVHTAPGLAVSVSVFLTLVGRITYQTLGLWLGWERSGRPGLHTPGLGLSLWSCLSPQERLQSLQTLWL